MASRRGQNRIRGPHSALTDFLAANNISARQIREDYARRQQETAEQQSDTAENGEEVEDGAQEDDEELEATLAQQRSKKRRRQSEAVLKTKTEKEKTKQKKVAKQQAKKKKKGKGRDSDDDSESDGFSDDSDVKHTMYRKAKPAPGQFDNCELCEKRFTVTPYSKTGPDGGLLCGPCGKALNKDAKSSKPAAPTNNPAGKRRRKVESDRMDGVVRVGAKPLVQHCIETAVKYHDEIESLDNMPDHLIERISQLFSKHRVMNSTTLPLFLRADKNAIKMFDCAYLKTEDYNRIFAELPKLKSLTLHNAYQFKDSNIDYLMDKGRNLKEIKIYAANLVSSERWSMFFRTRGFNLTTIKLTWLDASFSDEQVADLVRFCPNVERLKLENCWLLSEESIDSIAELENLKHLSLKFIKQIPTENMIRLISAVGPQLETLSLRNFKDLDDEFLDAVHSSCTQLTKLRVAENDTATDEGWENLFTDWDNPPLEIVDLSGVRDVDNQQPDGPRDAAIGFAGAGFQALMAHCGDNLRHLDISGCRHIPLSNLAEVFQLGASFSRLQDVDFSFVQNVDDVVLAGLFKASAGALKKVALFGCFGITTDAIVPRGVVVVGAPRIGIEEQGMEVWGSTDMYEVQATKGKAVEMNGVMNGLKVEQDAMELD